MPGLRELTRSLRRWRLLEDVAVNVVYASVKILAALPGRWILNLGDALGTLLSLVDRRGRAVAFQNMQVAFGDGKSARERKRIYRASCQGVMRSMLLLLHIQPMTAKKFRRWVDVEDVSEMPQTRKIRERGAVFVSGHIGNWELILGLRTLYQHFPPSTFLAEEIPHHAVNRLLQKLRSHADVMSAFRKGGTRALVQTLKQGGTAGLIVDRNVRRALGGIWVPFFGLPARTTPLPAWLATRHDVPVYPIFCFPRENGRYRLWLGPDVTENLRGTTEHETNREIMGRINDVLEDVIRAQPELWTWSLKRFKSRPERELGDYPAYSTWDWNQGMDRH
jgi:KDO2-lipid IV(A) lauroyltransferase